MNAKCLIASLLGALMCATAANAVIYIQFEEVGSDVVATGSGSANTTDLSSAASNDIKGMNLAFGFFTIGVSDNEFWVTTSGPGGNVLGTSGYVEATSTSGDAMGYGSGGASIVLPVGYSSGDFLTGSATWAGQTFDSLELNLGTYVWTWGSGANADSMTVTIVPEPSFAAVFLGLGVMGVAARRRKRQS